MDKNKIAVFAGSFDPFTLGHLDIVRRASELFDALWILVAKNESKKNMFDVETRMSMIELSVSNLSNVKVDCFNGLTVDFMQSVGARYLVRGVRGSVDLDYEQAVAWNNRNLDGNAETVLLLSAPEHLSISSSVVRELLKCGFAGKNIEEKLSKFVPCEILKKLLTEYRKG